MKKIILCLVLLGQGVFANTNYIDRYELEVNISGKLCGIQGQLLEDGNLYASFIGKKDSCHE